MLKLMHLAMASAALTLGASVATAQNAPAVSLNSFLEYDVYEDGNIAIEDTDIAFAPSTPCAKAVIRKANGGTVASHGFYDEYRMSAQVFGRIRPVQSPVVKLRPGDYVMEFQIGRKKVTAFPFSVAKASDSSDPFAPGSTYKWTGPWQKWAYLAPDAQRSGAAAALYFWAGSNDVDATSKRRLYIAKVYRNGKLIAQSKRGVGTITSRWMERHKVTLLQPHSERNGRNASVVPLSELAKPGSYRIDVELIDNGEVFRTFAFRSSGGKIMPHPRTVLGQGGEFKQDTYIFPRAPDPRSSSYTWREVHWISR